MDTDRRQPSKTTDRYWLLCVNEAYAFKKEKSFRQSGKWLIFAHKSVIDETWEKVKQATLQGLLGPSSKVSTAKENPNSNDPSTKVICVFTEDYNNQEDVQRIKDALRSLQIENKLSYKLDRDVGKYEKTGHTNLVQEVSYSSAYFELLEQIKRNEQGNNIQLIETDSEGGIQFRLSRANLSEAAYQHQIIRLKKLGFNLQTEESTTEGFLIFQTEK